MAGAVDEYRKVNILLTNIRYKSLPCTMKAYTAAVCVTSSEPPPSPSQQRIGISQHCRPIARRPRHLPPYDTSTGHTGARAPMLRSFYLSQFEGSRYCRLRKFLESRREHDFGRCRSDAPTHSADFALESQSKRRRPLKLVFFTVLRI